MRTILSAAALAAVTMLSFVACAGGGQKSNTTVTEPDEPEVMGKEWDLAKDTDVYITGYCRRLFKNGVTYRLDDKRIRFGTSVCVSGEDVYIACETEPPTLTSVPGALLCKNGAAVTLEGGLGSNYPARPHQVVVTSGGDVYVAGHINSRAVQWVNGKLQHLGNGNDNGQATCAFASGNDVYVGGYELGVGAAWKNGVRQDWHLSLGDGRSSRVHSLFVSGDDVYAAMHDIVGTDDPRATGLFKDRPLLWKNGVFQKLPSNGVNGDVARSVFVSGKDVYIIGEEYNERMVPLPVLWKNGVKQKLTDGSSHAWANSVAVLNGNVYIAGYQTEGSGVSAVHVPTLWINGEAVDLRPSGMTGMAWSVFLMEKGK